MFAATTLLAILLSLASAIESKQLWVWTCDSTEGSCIRLSVSDNTSSETFPTVELCRLVCGQNGPLWPLPTTPAQLSRELILLASNNIIFLNTAVDQESLDFLKVTEDYFKSIISKVETINCIQKNSLTINVNVELPMKQLNWDTDESYQLNIKTEGTTTSVSISAKTVFGGRHGVETLAQLIDVIPDKDEGRRNCLAIVKTAQIDDAPVYPHRGLLLDTARNFQPVEVIKRHIDAMAASKLNVLHWHVTDSQSFPLELSRLPNMTKYGAYSPKKIYQIDDVQELFSYAKSRGIRIIIEIDAPSHAGNGWQWGPDAGLGHLTVCKDQQPYRSYCIQPPCGQLNPANQNLYGVLKSLYTDILEYLPKGEIFHMGGDEVYIPCWNSTQEILDYIGNKPRTTETFLELWSEYQAKALAVFDQAAGNSETPILLWTSHLTNTTVIEKYLSNDRYIIQTWVPAEDTLPKDLLKLGYKIIVSTKDAWYLDHGFWGSTKYHDWRTIYNNKIPEKSDGVYGGEVCMWGEYTDGNSVESKTWPRAAAAAERLWSNPKTSSASAEVRFYRHRQRLVNRGIHADALIPQWCYQNERQCD